jgi:hypothetical protein
VAGGIEPRCWSSLFFAFACPPHEEDVASDMARSRPASFEKRKREMAKKAKRDAKRELRALRKEQKVQRPRRTIDGQDPDLAGIRLGP